MPKSRTYRCLQCGEGNHCEVVVYNDEEDNISVPRQCILFKDALWERVVPPHECQGSHTIEYRSDENEWLLPVPFHKGEYIVCAYCPFCGEHLEAH